MSTPTRLADIARAELTDLRASYARYCALSLDSTGDEQRIANARANRILAAIKVVSAEVAASEGDAIAPVRTYAPTDIATHPALAAMAADPAYLASHGIRRRVAAR